MDNLTILSLGRNLIKKIENLDGVADTLEELWVSYNLIDKLTNIEKLTKLRILYLHNNKISSWGELEKLQALENLEEILLVGNPLFENTGTDQTKIKSEWRIEVLKRLPNLKKIDGVPVDVEEKDMAADA